MAATDPKRAFAPMESLDHGFAIDLRLAIGKS
jgi:hypothetical protein